MKSKKNYETNRTNIIDTLKEGEREREEGGGETNSDSCISFFVNLNVCVS